MGLSLTILRYAVISCCEDRGFGELGLTWVDYLKVKV